MLRNKDALINPLVEVLQHRVKGCIYALHLCELLNTDDIRDIHIPHDLHGVGTPWCHQLTPCTDEVARERHLIER